MIKLWDSVLPLGNFSARDLGDSVFPGGIFKKMKFVTDALALTERILIDGLL